VVVDKVAEMATYFAVNRLFRVMAKLSRSATGRRSGPAGRFRQFEQAIKG